MSFSVADILRAHAKPLEPLPTGTEPVLRRLDGVRAVLFDVYGTLFVSGCGDVGTEAVSGRAEAAEASLAAVELTTPASGEEVVRVHDATIRRHHERVRAKGIEFPEVDIVQIWREVVGELSSGTEPAVDPIGFDAARLAVEYEARVNPSWPMPGMVECLQSLQAAGMQLGLVSNAQFYTQHLFPALVGRSVDELGFDQELLLFSFQHGQAKPGDHLYRQAADRLARRGIRPDEVLYVGNDMLKDVLPASRAGFHTALFAGDARSFRRRQDDPRVGAIEPDLVVTELGQMGGTIGP